LTVIVPVHRRSVVHGLPPIRLHDLRHTAATLALTAGIHPKVVSVRLGHASVGITLDTYSHVGEGLEEEAASRVAGLIFGDSDDKPGR
jgi:integrase